MAIHRPDINQLARMQILIACVLMGLHAADSSSCAAPVSLIPGLLGREAGRGHVSPHTTWRVGIEAWNAFDWNATAAAAEVAERRQLEFVQSQRLLVPVESIRLLHLQARQLIAGRVHSTSIVGRDAASAVAALNTLPQWAWPRPAGSEAAGPSSCAFDTIRGIQPVIGHVISEMIDIRSGNASFMRKASRIGIVARRGGNWRLREPSSGVTVGSVAVFSPHTSLVLVPGHVGSPTSAERHALRNMISRARQLASHSPESPGYRINAVNWPRAALPRATVRSGRTLVMTAGARLGLGIQYRAPCRGSAFDEAAVPPRIWVAKVDRLAAPASCARVMRAAPGLQTAGSATLASTTTSRRFAAGQAIAMGAVVGAFDSAVDASVGAPHVVCGGWSSANGATAGTAASSSPLYSGALLASSGGTDLTAAVKAARRLIVNASDGTLTQPTVLTGMVLGSSAPDRMAPTYVGPVVPPTDGETKTPVLGAVAVQPDTTLQPGLVIGTAPSALAAVQKSRRGWVNVPATRWWVTTKRSLPDSSLLATTSPGTRAARPAHISSLTVAGAYNRAVFGRWDAAQAGAARPIWQQQGGADGSVAQYSLKRWQAERSRHDSWQKGLARAAQPLFEDTVAALPVGMTALQRATAIGALQRTQVWSGLQYGAVIGGNALKCKLDVPRAPDIVAIVDPETSSSREGGCIVVGLGDFAVQRPSGQTPTLRIQGFSAAEQAVFALDPTPTVSAVYSAATLEPVVTSATGTAFRGDLSAARDEALGAVVAISPSFTALPVRTYFAQACNIPGATLVVATASFTDPNLGSGPFSERSASRALPAGAPVAPNAPTSDDSLQAIAGNTGALVQWTAPPDSGSPMLGYTVEVEGREHASRWSNASARLVAIASSGAAPAAGLPAAKARLASIRAAEAASHVGIRTAADSLPGPVTIEVIRGLRARVQYRFCVRAFNALGVSTRSSWSRWVTIRGAAPAAPTVTANLSAPDEATARVVASAEDGGAPADIIRIEYSEDGGNTYSSPGALFLPADTISVPNLAPGKSLLFRAVAESSIGVSPPSNPVQLATPASQPCPPQALRQTASLDPTTGARFAVMMFDVPACTGGDAHRISKYLVTEVGSPDPNWLQRDIGLNQQVELRQLAAGSSATVRVVAESTMGLMSTPAELVVSAPPSWPAAASASGISVSAGVRALNITLPRLDSQVTGGSAAIGWHLRLTGGGTLLAESNGVDGVLAAVAPASDPQAVGCWSGPEGAVQRPWGWVAWAQAPGVGRANESHSPMRFARIESPVVTLPPSTRTLIEKWTPQADWIGSANGTVVAAAGTPGMSSNTTSVVLQVCGLQPNAKYTVHASVANVFGLGDAVVADASTFPEPPAVPPSPAVEVPNVYDRASLELGISFGVDALALGKGIAVSSIDVWCSEVFATASPSETTQRRIVASATDAGVIAGTGGSLAVRPSGSVLTMTGCPMLPGSLLSLRFAARNAVGLGELSDAKIERLPMLACGSGERASADNTSCTKCPAGSARPAANVYDAQACTPCDRLADGQPMVPSDSGDACWRVPLPPATMSATVQQAASIGQASGAISAVWQNELGSDLATDPSLQATLLSHRVFAIDLSDVSGSLANSSRLLASVPRPDGRANVPSARPKHEHGSSRWLQVPSGDHALVVPTNSLPSSAVVCSASVNEASSCTFSMAGGQPLRPLQTLLVAVELTNTVGRAGLAAAVEVRLPALQCPAGTAASPSAQQCDECPAGSVSPGGEAGVDAVCLSCPPGHITAADTARVGCARCEAGTFAAASRTECQACAQGQYSVAGSERCIECPKLVDAGLASCDSGQLSIPSFGMWIAPEQSGNTADGSLQLMGCPRPQSCITRMITNATNPSMGMTVVSECAVGYSGPMCLECARSLDVAESYGNVGGECLKCPETQLDSLMLLGGLAAGSALVAAVLVRRSVLASENAASSTRSVLMRITLSWIAMQSSLGDFAIKAPELLASSFALTESAVGGGLGMDSRSVVCAIPAVDYRTRLFGLLIIPPAIMAVVAALLVLCKPVWGATRAASRISGRRRQTAQRRRQLQGNSRPSIVLATSSAKASLQQQNSSNQSTTAGSGPNLVQNPMRSVAALPQGAATSPWTADAGPPTVMQWWYASVVVLAFLLHSRLSVTVFGAFACYPDPIIMNGEAVRVLRAAPSVRCDDPLVGLFGIIGIAAYAVGIPAAAVAALAWNRKRLQSPPVRRALGFLLVGYKPSAFAWEVAAVLPRKVAVLAIAATVRDPLLSAYLGQGVVVVALVAHAAVRPFSHSAANLAETVSLSSTFATLFLSFVTTRTQGIDDIVLWGLIALNLGAAATFVALLLVGPGEEASRKSKIFKCAYRSLFCTCTRNRQSRKARKSALKPAVNSSTELATIARRESRVSLNPLHASRVHPPDLKDLLQHGGGLGVDNLATHKRMASKRALFGTSTARPIASTLGIPRRR